MAQPPPPHSLAKQSRPSEAIVQAFLLFCGALSIFVTVGIVVVLGRESFGFFTSDEVNIWQFFTTTEWQPAIGNTA